MLTYADVCLRMLTYADSKGGKESMQVHIWYQICLLCKYKSTNSDTSEQSMQIQQSNWQIVC